jgi:hypothetical protein
MNNYCYANYLHGVWVTYSNKDFLVANKQNKIKIMFTKPTPVVRQIMITWCLIVYPKIRHHGHIPNSCFVLQLILFTAKLSNIFNVRRDIRKYILRPYCIAYSDTLGLPSSKHSIGLALWLWQKYLFWH